MTTEEKIIQYLAQGYTPSETGMSLNVGLAEVLSVQKVERLKSLLRRAADHVRASYKDHHRLEDWELLKAIGEAVS
jgi:hypothetical protein